MERTEIVSLFKNTPADGTEITVCGWAKNIRDSKNIGFQHDLQGLEAAAVRQGDEADVLGVADVLCPAAYGDDRTIGGGVLVQRNDLSAFHFQITSDIK